jgi:hypothetical protein
VLRRELVEGWERGRFDIVCLRISDYVSEGGCVRGYSGFKVEAVCCVGRKVGSASRETRAGTPAAKSKRVLAGIVSRTFFRFLATSTGALRASDH